MTADSEPYLAFCDGSLDFICGECTAICCRGQGFGGSLRREAGELLRIYPELATVAVGRQGDVLSFASPTGACFFLDSDLRCRIEKEHRRALKPGVCTLFPFNHLTRVGKTVVVLPHFLCPLRLASPPRPGAVEGSHDRVRELAREVRLCDEPETIRAQSLPPDADARSLLERERSFRDLCTGALGRRTFRETLEQASGGDASLVPFLSRATGVLGRPLARPGPRDELDDLPLALAPALRISMLRLSSEGMIRALALAEQLLRAASSLAPSSLTLQGAHQIVSSGGPALRLLARADDPVRPPGATGGKLPDFCQPDLALAAAVLLRTTERPTGTLDAIEPAIPASMGAADRSVLLLQVGMVLEQEQTEPQNN